MPLIDSAGPGDDIQLLMFYLADRRVIGALKKAHKRGAVVLDPNKDAFGRQKNGIPNRPVARELNAAGVEVRWCYSPGEQCHEKLLLLRRAGGAGVLVAGSANFTRRNLTDYNLETDVVVRGSADHPVVAAAQRYFDTVWDNDADRRFSVPYEVYENRSWWLRCLYHFMEASGMSAF